MKKFGSAITLIIMLLAVAATGFFVGNKPKVKTEPQQQQTKILNSKQLRVADLATQDAQQSSWLVFENDGEVLPYDAAAEGVVAGQTVGYGKFVLNAQNALLTTQANAGFELVGWQFSYLVGGTTNKNTFVKFGDAAFDDDAASLTKQNNTLIYTIKQEAFAEQPVAITMDFLDADADGFFDEGSFNISNVFSNMKVEPVFNYIYYGVDVKAIFDFANIKFNYATTSANGGTLFYPQGESAPYSNAFLQTENQVLFYQNVWFEGSRFYTTRMQNGVQQKIDLARGAFRAGEVVNLNFKINALANFLAEDCVNVDIKSASLIEDNTTTELQPRTQNSTRWVEFLTDEYKRSTGLNLQFDIATTRNHVSSLGVVAHQLFVAQISALVDSKNSDNGNAYILNSIEIVLNSLQINYTFSTISSNNHVLMFFVKNSSDDENNNIFEILCQKTIVGENLSYRYYTFANITIDGQASDAVNDNVLRYANITKNFNVEVAYTSVEYSIVFEPFLKVEDKLIRILDQDFLVNQPVSQLRGTQYVCAFAAAEQNVGYNFLGYATDKAILQDLTIEIDYARPQDVTVKMIYEYVNYTVNLKGYDSIELINSSMRYFPIESWVIKVNNNNLKFDLQQFRPTGAKDITFANNLKLGDAFSLVLTARNGFVIKSLYIDKSAPDLFAENLEELNTIEFNFVITQNFLQSLMDLNLLASPNININIEEDFVRYNFAYFIEQGYDAAKGTNVIMADISAQTTDGEAVFSYYYFGEEEPYTSTQPGKDLVRIEIANLKLYDTVTMFAKTKTVQGDDGADYTYKFSRFTDTENKGTSLAHTMDEQMQASASRLVDKNNIEIEVIYYSSSSLFVIETNFPGAFGNEFSKQIFFKDYLEISQVQEGGVSTTIEIDDKNQAIILSGMFTVKFKPNKTFNFGYRFADYTLTVNGIIAAKESQLQNAYPYEQRFLATLQDDDACVLTLNFELINFELTLKQHGQGYVNGQLKTFGGELYVFENGNNFGNLNVENALLKINLPEGAFVNRFYFVNNGFEINLENVSQTNSTTQETFEHKFSVEQITNYFVIYGQNMGNRYLVELNVEYVLHTYNIDANYAFNFSKGNAKDNAIVYPALVLSYEFNGQPFNFKTSANNKQFVFENVPYGVKVLLGLATQLPVGYRSNIAWEDSKQLGDECLNIDGLDYIQILKLTSNRKLTYKIDYYRFAVVVTQNNGLGETAFEVLENGEFKPHEDFKLELFDEFRFVFTPYREQGFKFGSMFYYTPYTLGADGWQANYLNLFVFENGVFKQATNFDLNQTYYLRNVYAESVIYQATFNANSFAIINNAVYFEVNYDFIRANIVNLTEDFNANYSLTKVGIPLSEYATYVVYKKVDNQFVDISTLEDKTVVVYDALKVEIKFNTVSVQNLLNDNANEFDLAKGLKLVQISYLTSFGSNQVEFNMQQMMPYLDETDTLNLTYYYALDFKTIELTTNITSQKFYKNFTMSYENLGNFEGNGTSNNQILTNEMQFLGTTLFKYAFNTKDEEFFKIENLKVYRKINNKYVQADPDEFYALGIELEYGDKLQIRARFVENLKIELQVEPIIIYNNCTQDENGDYWFEKVFECNELGVGKPQTLTKGETKSSDIQTSSLILACMQIKFVDESGYNVNPTNVGNYIVLISFHAPEELQEEYDWVEEIILSYNLFLKITPKPIYLSNDVFTFEKVYDGGSSINFGQVAQYLKFVDNNTFVMYLTDGVGRFKFLQTPTGTITFTNNEDRQVETFNAGTRLNIVLSNLALYSDAFNNNFKLELENDSYVILGVVTIRQRDLNLVATTTKPIYDKVFDGTTAVDYDNANFALGSGLLEKDKGLVAVDFANLTFEFEDGAVGKNKVINVTSNNALKDVIASSARAQNYKLVLNSYTATIYPYSVTCYVAGVGDVTISNQRGRINPNDAEHSYRDYVNLIPLDAKLEVSVILPDSLQYRQIYPFISQHLSMLTVFGIGYKINFDVNGTKKSISNGLFLTLPKISRIKQSLWLSASESGRLSYNLNGQQVTIDLSQMDRDFEGLIFTQSRVLLTWWQICLIILLIILIIVLIVLWYIHRRRVKRQRDALNEKI